jgi:spore coat polysaccharide biosynthesis predicted glycosyltransferase SpsG
MRLQIICRGSKQQGLGHLFRTRTFARAAEAAGHDVHVVAIIEEELESILDELTCPVAFVRRDGETVSCVEAVGPEVLLFDLTGIEEATFESLRGLAPLTVSLSPVFAQMDRVDALFTRVANTPPIAGVRIYSGMQYAVFGDQCAPIDDATYERALASPALPIAVCMGGADAANKTLQVVQAVVELEAPIVLWVLLGEGYVHSYSALVTAVRAARRHEVILAKTNRSMWQVMGNCALAVLAGGLTTVEAVYAGLPSINLFERQEHWEQMRELLDRGICVDGGYFSEESLVQMTQVLRSLSYDRRKLRLMHQQMRGKVDREGSGRILAELQTLSESREYGSAEAAAVIVDRLSDCLDGAKR